MLSNKTDYFLRSELWFFSFLLQLPHLSLLSQCTISAALFLPPFSHPLGVTSFLLRTQGQLSHILVINAPSRPQSLCHYGPIVAGNSGHSLRTSNRVRQMRVGGGWGVTKDYKAHCCPLSTSLHTHIGVRAHTHTTKPATSQQVSQPQWRCEECWPCQRRPLLNTTTHCSVISGLLH